MAFGLLGQRPPLGLGIVASGRQYRALPRPQCLGTQFQLRQHQLQSSRASRRWSRLRPAALKADEPTSTAASRQPASPAAAVSPISGYGALLTVSFLWGSYNPVVRWLYEQDHPLEPSTLTAIRTVMAAVVMAGAIAWNRAQPTAAEPEIEAAAEEDTIPAPHGDLKFTESTASEDEGAVSQPDQQPAAAGAGARLATADAAAAAAASKPLLARTFDSVIPAGIELGMYNFLGTSLQTMGLQLTSATRAGFLVQLTAVLVPLLASAAGIQVSRRLWLAASLALSGTCLIALDNSAGGDSAQGVGLGGAVFGLGDTYLVVACLFYALATVRLGFYAPHHSSVELAGVKKFTLCAASLAWLAAAQGGLGLDGLGSLVGQQSGFEWLVITYSALGCGALATFLQTAGQSTVPATLAQVIYSLTPLWSALLAFLLLGDDGMGSLGWGGSAAIVAASLIATTSQMGRKHHRPAPEHQAATFTAPATADHASGFWKLPSAPKLTLPWQAPTAAAAGVTAGAEAAQAAVRQTSSSLPASAQISSAGDTEGAPPSSPSVQGDTHHVVGELPAAAPHAAATQPTPGSLQGHHIPVGHGMAPSEPGHLARGTTGASAGVSEPPGQQRGVQAAAAAAGASHDSEDGGEEVALLRAQAVLLEQQLAERSEELAQALQLASDAMALAERTEQLADRRGAK